MGNSGPDGEADSVVGVGFWCCMACNCMDECMDECMLNLRVFFGILWIERMQGAYEGWRREAR